MAKVIKTQKAFFNGQSILLNEGVEFDDASPIVAKYPEAFEVSKKAEPKKAKKAPVKEEIVLTETVEAPKEELLIEEPVQALEITEEETEVEEEKPKRRKRK